MEHKICPECKKKIDYLTWSGKAMQVGNFDLNGGYVVVKEENDDDEFGCPECDEILFTNRDKASDFLHDKIELAIKRL